MPQKGKGDGYFGPNERDFFAALRGGRALFVLLGGQQLEAVVLGVDKYHVLVRRPDGLTLLVPKHSILYVAAKLDLPEG